MFYGRRFAYIVFFGILLAAGIPNISFAAGSVLSFTQIFPESCYCTNQLIPGSETNETVTTAPDYGCLLQLIQNVVNAAILLGILLCVVWIAYGGFSLMISGGSAEARSLAKTRLLNAIVGIAVILCSWLIVDFVMKVIYEPSTALEGKNFGPWNTILAGTGHDYCIQPTNPSALTTGSLSIIVGSGGSAPSAQYGTGGTGGSCSVPSNGACSIAALQNTCFGRRVNEASRVCNLESAGGNPAIKSGSDKLNSGNGPSYSIGLWQINLTTTDVGGLPCRSAFTTACQGSALIRSHPGWCSASIKPGKEDLYNRCVTAAQNPTYNYEAACSLFNSRGFQPWTYSANKCSVPLK